MAVKLGLVKELLLLIAAYLQVRTRRVLRQFPVLSRAGHGWMSVFALAGGVLIGLAFGQWTATEETAATKASLAPPNIVIEDKGNQVYEVAVAVPSPHPHDHTPHDHGDAHAVAVDAVSGVVPGREPPISGPLITELMPPNHVHQDGVEDEVAVARLTPPSSAARTGSTVPAWRRHAVAISYPPHSSLIAIVIDDIGLNVRSAARTIALRGPLTLSFMSYARNLEAQTETARAAGHELMVHLPMEPLDSTEDPGPNVLLTRLPPEENLRRLRWALDRFGGYIGINNHMGSRFTQHEAGMALVMNELSARGLMFLDSRTVRGSVSAAMAQRYNVPFVSRDVFLDNVPVEEQVKARLDELETVARLYGRAVGIAHPRRGTLDALEAWLPTIEARGFKLVPLSALLLNPAGTG